MPNGDGDDDQSAAIANKKEQEESVAAGPPPPRNLSVPMICVDDDDKYETVSQTMSLSSCGSRKQSTGSQTAITRSDRPRQQPLPDAQAGLAEPIVPQRAASPVQFVNSMPDEPLGVEAALESVKTSPKASPTPSRRSDISSPASRKSSPQPSPKHERRATEGDILRPLRGKPAADVPNGSVASLSNDTRPEFSLGSSSGKTSRDNLYRSTPKMTRSSAAAVPPTMKTTQSRENLQKTSLPQQPWPGEQQPPPPPQQAWTNQRMMSYPPMPNQGMGQIPQRTASSATLNAELEAGKRAQMKTKKEKAVLSDLCTKSDFHGLPDLYDSRDSCLRASIWAIIVIVTFTICGIELWNTVEEFYENPIFSEYEFVADSTGIPFPEVYICPGNKIHRSNEKLARVNETWYQENVNFTESSACSQCSLSVFASLSELFVDDEEGPSGTQGDTVAWIPADQQAYYMRVGYNERFLFNECIFGGQKLNCSAIVTPVFDKDYYKCFRVKVDKTQTTAGVGLVLSLDLDIENGYSKSEPPSYHGLTVRVDNELDLRSQEKLLIPAGSQALVTMKHTRLHLLRTWRSEADAQCVYAEEAREQFLVLNASYSQPTCQLDCIADYVLSTCGCLHWVDRQFLSNEPRVASAPFCNVEQLENCAGVAAINRAKPDSQEHIAGCSAKCLIACELWQYDTTVSSAPFYVRDEKTSGWVQSDDKPELKTELIYYTHPCLFTLETGECPSGDAPVNATWNLPDERFYYDADTDSCLPFTYMGCNGNFNRYESLEVCVRDCVNDKSYEYWEEYCGEDVYEGKSCAPVRYYYSQDTQQCESFIFHGCRQNKNNFEFEDDCKITCRDVPDEPAAVVDESPVEGSGEDEKVSGPKIDYKSLIVLDMNFASLQYVEITQENSMSFSTFVGNVGGQVGLWVGASIITMIKFILIICEVCCGYGKKPIKKKVHTFQSRHHTAK